MASTSTDIVARIMASATNDTMLCGPAPTTVVRRVLLETGQSGPVERRAVKRRRLITPEAGRAIEMLGHAIEYLADEHALGCISRRDKGERQEGALGGKHPQVVAIELLMARNREVYFSCPEVPTLGERLRAWLHVQRA